MADWIPKREAELAALANKWIAALEKPENQTLWAWDPDECTATGAALAAFVAAGSLFQEDDSIHNRIARNEAKVIAVRALRDFADTSILHNKKMPDEDRVYFGVHLPDKTPTPHPVPGSRPVIAGMKALGGFQIEIRVHDEHTPDSRAILPGCNGCLAYYAYGSERITGYALRKETKLLTRFPNILSLPPEAAGNYLSCACRWQNNRGELGPWSDIEYIIIA